jgi:hypothetical protein
VSAEVGELTMTASGHIKGGQTAYDTGSGFYLGYTGSKYKFSIGNASTGQTLTWDGTNLNVSGKIYARNYVSGSTEILAANTERLATSYSAGYVKLKEFAVTRKGVLNFQADVKSDPDTAAIIVVVRPYYKVVQNSVNLVAPVEITQESYTTKNHDITISDPDAGLIEVWVACGDANNILPPGDIDLKGWIKNVKLKNDFRTDDAVVTD